MPGNHSCSRAGSPASAHTSAAGRSMRISWRIEPSVMPRTAAAASRARTPAAMTSAASSRRSGRGRRAAAGTPRTSTARRRRRRSSRRCRASSASSSGRQRRPQALAQEPPARRRAARRRAAGTAPRRRANVPTLPIASNRSTRWSTSARMRSSSGPAAPISACRIGRTAASWWRDGGPAQVVEVVEVAEHGARREPGPGGDGVGARRQLAVADQLEQGVDDGVAVAIPAQATSVGGWHRRHPNNCQSD